MVMKFLAKADGSWLISVSMKMQKLNKKPLVIFIFVLICVFILISFKSLKVEEVPQKETGQTTTSTKEITTSTKEITTSTKEITTSTKEITTSIKKITTSTKEVLEGKIKLVIESPLNKTYYTNNVLLKVSASNVTTWMGDSIDNGRLFIACYNCDSYWASFLKFENGTHVFTVYAGDYENKTTKKSVIFTVA